MASRPTRRTELGVFHRLRDQLYWEVREWLRADPGAMLPPDEELLEELRAPDYEIRNGEIYVMKKLDMKEVIGRSPDRLDSLALTFAPAAGIQGGAVTSDRKPPRKNGTAWGASLR